MPPAPPARGREARVTWIMDGPSTCVCLWNGDVDRYSSAAPPYITTTIAPNRIHLSSNLLNGFRISRRRHVAPKAQRLDQGNGDPGQLMQPMPSRPDGNRTRAETQLRQVALAGCFAHGG